MLMVGKDYFQLMATAQLRSQLFAAAMACVLVLPYAAPVVCGGLGRMGGEMEMSAQADSAVSTPGDGTTCCNLDECGAPRAAPLANGLDVLRQIAEFRTALPAAPTVNPISDRLPPTPPPEV